MRRPEGRLPRLLSPTVKTIVGVVVPDVRRDGCGWTIGRLLFVLLGVFKIILKKMEIKMTRRAQQHDRLNICQKW